jgi:hypothetical protein
MHAFMKDKLRNRLGLHLDAIVFIFDKSFILKKLLQFGRIKKSWLVLPFSRFYSFHNKKLKCSCFHDLDKFGDCASDCAWFPISLRGLLTFACGGWDFELHWAKSDIRLEFNSPSNCVQFVFSFRFGFASMSLMSLFLIPFQPRSHILHWFVLVGAS